MIIDKLSFYDSETYGGLKSIWAINGNKEIGMVSYRTKEPNQAHIESIWVVPDAQRKGIARQLIERLISKYTYQQVYWGRTTADGLRLKEYFDRLYGVNANERVEHLDYDHTLKLFKTFNQTYYDLLVDLCTLGSPSALIKWRRDGKANWLIDNQVAVIKLKTVASWIKTSLMNTHAEAESMPRMIYTLINELGIPI